VNTHATIEKMKLLRLYAMAQVHYAAIHEKMYTDYTQDEYIGLLVDQEWENRQHRKISNMINKAAFKLQTSIRDIDYTAHRGLDKNAFERLLTLEFIKQHQNIIITGPTGVGKSYLAQVIGNHACTMLNKTIYYNTARLMEVFRTARLDGSYLKLMSRIKRTPLLILDDFGLAPFDANSRQVLMDLIEDRHDQASTIITSQIPVNKWHDLIGEGTIADAILDRIVNAAHRITLSGKSLRKKIDQISN
jgi:DNA replication protein DnaC